jgi:hypothetical protein
LLTEVEVRDGQGGEITGRVVDNDFGLIQFEEKV